LKAAPVVNRRAFRFPMTAYLEAHIEQGPVLEAAGKTIGVVSGIQGLRWFRVEVTGEEAHAGTTPRARRRDALLAAVDMVRALRVRSPDLRVDPGRRRAPGAAAYADRFRRDTRREVHGRTLPHRHDLRAM